MTCPFCEERPSELPNGSCTECAMDETLDQLIYAAAKRAWELGIECERFMELGEAAHDIASARIIEGWDEDIDRFHKVNGALVH